MTSADATAPPARPHRFARWSENALLLFLVITGIVTFLLLTAGPARFVPIVLLAGALSVGVLVTIIRGLRAGAEWAIPAAIVVLWLIAAQGILDTVVKLSEGGINIPIGTIVALIALLGAPAPPFSAPQGAPGRVLVAIVLAYLAAWLVPSIATMALGRMGP